MRATGLRVAGLRVTALLVAGLCAAPLAACTATSASAHRSASPADSYGALPTFLPTPSIQADSMITGSPGRPAVTSQGDTVQAAVSGGSVQMSVVGPVVPGEGLPLVTPATTCTWTVHMSNATTSVPIRLDDFLAVDEDGAPFRLQFVPGEKRPPATLAKGQDATFRLRVVMPTGEGVMRWQPSGHLLALWDFVVEND